MTRCDKEQMVDLARGKLSPAEARDATAHAADCVTCAGELAWARAEAELFSSPARRSRVPAHVWQGVERRIVVAAERLERRRRMWAGGGALASLAAAAAALVVLWQDPTQRALLLDGGSSAAGGAPVVEVTNTLDKAEAEYAKAIQVLEADWETRRAGMAPERAARVDSELSQLRTLMTENRTLAGVDPEGRRRALRTYSAYMRTMKAAVLEDEP